jgi:hypothetical protein
VVLKEKAMRAAVVYLVLSTALSMFGLSANAVAEPYSFQTPRPDGSLIHWSLDRPAGAQQVGVIVLAQGSGCLSVDHNDNLKLARSAFADLAVVTVEKYGVEPGDDPQDDHEAYSQAFRAHHTMSQRVADYRQVIDLIRREPWWNGRLDLFEGSEGGDVVAQLSASTAADAVILISTGGGDTFGELVKASILAEMTRNAVPKPQWPDVETAFETARRNPESPQVWAESSYRFWADAIDKRVVDSMLVSPSAFLLIQGGEDVSVSVASARQVADRFAAAKRCNLTYWEFPSYDHGMIDADGNQRLGDVLMAAATWLNGRRADDRTRQCAQPSPAR